MSVIIRLQGLPLSASSGDIRTFFSGLGIPDGAVNIVGGDEGDAFIGFATDEDARQAIRKNNGLIHNSEVRLFLSSRTEMKEVIDNARAASSVPPLPINPAQPRFGAFPPRYEREDQSRFTRKEPPRFEREDQPRFNREEAPRFEKIDHPRYGRDGTSTGGNGVPPPLHQAGFLHPETSDHSRFDGRGDENGGGRRQMNRPPYGIQGSSFPSREMEQTKSGNVMNGRDYNRPPWENRGPVEGMRQQMMEGHSENERHAPLPTREPDYGIFGNRRDDSESTVKDNTKKEESWRKESNRSFDSTPSAIVPSIMPPINTKPVEKDSISFFSRGPSIVKRGGLLPPPILPPSLSSNLPPVPSLPTPPQQPKEEAFVELTRLPSDLLRPSALEEFLSPSTPLTLSSVKVVYGPGGIHLQSLVRFTSAMDAITALKKDGEQGVKIRVSTKEAFEGARDGPPLTIGSMPPMPPVPPMMGMGMGLMMGMPPAPQITPNLMNMPLMNPNERPREGMGRGERRRRDDSPSRRHERGRSPRTKRQKSERHCIRISNLHFRTKEPEIRRMIGHGINPFGIKKVFNEDNSPSDVWILEFSSEEEVNRTLNNRFEMAGRTARMVRIDEPEVDRLLRQKFRSPPRREPKRDSFDEKVRMQQEAIEMEKKMPHRGDSPPPLNALAGAFSAPVFTTNRGFMRGGRGAGRGMRGEFRGGMRGGRGGGVDMGGGPIRVGDRNCLLVSNMPHLPSPQILLEHLRVNPPSFVRCDQIAPDAAIIELRSSEEAIKVANGTSSDSFPPINGRRLVVAAMSRRQIEDEFNLRVRGGGEAPHKRHIDPEIVRSIGEPGCVIMCNGFPCDLAIDEVASFFDGFPIIESSVRMRMEGGEGTGECMLALRDGESTRRSVATLNGRPFRGAPVSICLL